MNRNKLLYRDIAIRLHIAIELYHYSAIFYIWICLDVDCIYLDFLDLVFLSRFRS